MRGRTTVAAASLVAALGLTAGAGAHELDHVAPTYQPSAPLGTGLNAGGPGAAWKLIDTFPTGNPHTDLDFFTQGGETYASVGTLAAGANAGGQTIVQLTNRGVVDPRHVSSHPSASCVSDPLAALGLQHDVEATPKPGADAQLLVDATDHRGRCHDQGTAGLVGAPRGGLELVDITNVLDPVEIGLTSHIGEAHTVNIDPKRPHIAYAVTSDAIGVGPGPEHKRLNENTGSSDRNDLDGFEVVDLSSCMNFPVLTSVDLRRALCRPQVYRYRFPSVFASLGHTAKGTIYGCHELEIYADDTLTCGSGAAGLVFDLSKAFDGQGRPKGTPLPCSVRPSSSVGPYFTAAMVTDCVVGEGGRSLDVPTWLANGAPSLEGVRHVGSIYHQGRGGPYDAKTDNDFDHELELTASGKFLIASDERGGGVVPPGATCATGVDNPLGNGGLHFYRRDALRTSTPATAEEAWDAYARTPEGGKAIYRATPRTGVEETVCTAHVFQQIPGQNRIFMGWYSQGTQVVDFVENADGTVTLKEAGWFIPEKANTWTSHVFKWQANADGTFTYWGATGDFLLGTTGRSAIDIYEVRLPAPPTPASASGGNSGGPGGGSKGGGQSGGGASSPSAGETPAAQPAGGEPSPQPTPAPEQPAAAPAESGVAGAVATQRRHVRGLGSIRVSGATKRATFQVDLAKGPRGKVVYRDLVSKLKLRFHNLKLGTVQFSEKTVTLRGTGIANGRRVTYAVTVVDRGAGPLDTFRIALSNGYVRAGTLVSGNVVVR